MPMIGRQDYQNCLCWLPQDDSNLYGFPEIKGIEELPEDAQFQNSEFARRFKDYDSWVMFYEWDWKFERMWQQPKRQAKWLMNYKGAIAPQFSLYANTPLALQIYSIYKSRWCGAYWESLGIPVIPCATWGAEDTYSFCFEGLPKHSIISVGGVGCHKDPVEDLFFRRGFEEMCNQLDPKLVIIGGAKWEGLPDVPIRYATTSNKLPNALDKPK